MPAALIDYDKRIFNLVRQGNYHQALWLAEEEFYVAEATFGYYHLETAKVLNNLGWLNDLLGNSELAEYQYKEALNIKRKVAGNAARELIPTMENLVNFYLNQGKNNQAYELLQEMIGIVEALPKIYRMRKCIYLCQLSDLAEQNGDFTAAEHFLLESLAYFQAHFDIYHPNVARIMAKLGALYERWGYLSRSEHYYNRAIAVMKRTLPSSHPDVQFVRDGLYNIYTQLGLKVRLP